jgi:hypothetical protein
MKGGPDRGVAKISATLCAPTDPQARRTHKRRRIFDIANALRYHQFATASYACGATRWAVPQVSPTQKFASNVTSRLKQFFFGPP